jgi:hypothetical protein
MARQRIDAVIMRFYLLDNVEARTVLRIVVVSVRFIDAGDEPPQLDGRERQELRKEQVDGHRGKLQAELGEEDGMAVNSDGT